MSLSNIDPNTSREDALSAKMVESDEEVSLRPVHILNEAKQDPMSITSLPLQKKHQIFAH